MLRGSSDGTELEQEFERIWLRELFSVCVRKREKEREIKRERKRERVLSRSVKLEWTPGPRLAVMSFLSTSSCWIRVTFQLWGWGGVHSFIYSIFYDQMYRFHLHSHFIQMMLLTKRSRGSVAATEEEGNFQQPSVHTHTHTPVALFPIQTMHHGASFVCQALPLFTSSSFPSTWAFHIHLSFLRNLASART